MRLDQIKKEGITRILQKQVKVQVYICTLHREDDQIGSDYRETSNNLMLPGKHFVSRKLWK
jgi:hypothetical protein